MLVYVYFGFPVKSFCGDRIGALKGPGKVNYFPGKPFDKDEGIGLGLCL